MKVTCIDYDLSKDQFIFAVTEVKSASDRIVDGQQERLTGDQIADLEDRKLTSCSDFEIAVFLLYRKHFSEEPASMLNKAFEI